MKTFMKTFMTKRKRRILWCVAKHLLTVLARFQDLQNTRSGGSCCNHEGVHDRRAGFARPACESGTAERGRPIQHLVIGFMTAIMNPFMTCPENFGDSSLQLRRGTSPPSEVVNPVPATSTQWPDLPPIARSPSLKTSPQDFVVVRLDSLKVRDDKTPVQGVHDSIRGG